MGYTRLAAILREKSEEWRTVGEETEAERDLRRRAPERANAITMGDLFLDPGPAAIYMNTNARAHVIETYTPPVMTQKYFAECQRNIPHFEPKLL